MVPVVVVDVVVVVVVGIYLSHHHHPKSLYFSVVVSNICLCGYTVYPCPLLYSPLVIKYDVSSVINIPKCIGVVSISTHFH